MTNYDTTSEDLPESANMNLNVAASVMLEATRAVKANGTKAETRLALPESWHTKVPPMGDQNWNFLSQGPERFKELRDSLNLTRITDGPIRKKSKCFK